MFMRTTQQCELCCTPRSNTLHTMHPYNARHTAPFAAALQTARVQCSDSRYLLSTRHEQSSCWRAKSSPQSVTRGKCEVTILVKSRTLCAILRRCPALVVPCLVVASRQSLDFSWVRSRSRFFVFFYWARLSFACVSNEVNIGQRTLGVLFAKKGLQVFFRGAEPMTKQSQTGVFPPSLQIDSPGGVQPPTLGKICPWTVGYLRVSKHTLRQGSHLQKLTFLRRLTLRKPLALS